MKRYFYILAISLLSLNMVFGQETREINTNLEVGALPGSFGVSPTGAATYTIPIDLPPGISGMTPELGFVYNSQSGIGIMGKGWSIGGLSAISRSPGTYYMNGYPSPVNFADDQMSLGGRKLIKVNQNANEYRFENDDMTKIVKQSMKNSRSDGFEYVVYSKSGLITTYGGSDESHLTFGVENNPALMYYISKIEDQFGNAIEYSYNQSNEEGSIYLSKIEYTVHNGSTKLIADYKVEFIYTELPEKDIKTTLFTKGVINTDLYKYKIGKRLIRVLLYYKSSLIGKYEIGYRLGGELNQWMVERIKMWRGLGNSYNSTSFKWMYDIVNNLNDVIVSYEWSDNPNFFPSIRIETADYTGNGINDIIELSTDNRQTKILLSVNKDGGENFQNDDSVQVGKVKRYYSADFNGDGKSELLVQTFNHGIKLYEFKQDEETGKYEFVVRTHPIEVNTNPDTQDLFPGDFNGDGIGDCISYSDNGTIKYYKGSETDLLVSTNIETEISNNNIDIYTGDFDGEGKKELLVFDHENEIGSILELNSNNTQFVQHIINLTIPQNTSIPNLIANYFATDKLYLVFADLNQDGKTDILTTNNQDDKINIFFSYGYDFEYMKTLDDIEHDNIFTADVNGDGVPDLITYKKNCGYNYEGCLTRRLTNIDGFTFGEPRGFGIGPDVPVFALGAFKFGNFSGTGKQDLVCSYIASIYHEDWSQITEVVYTGLKSINKISMITNGLGKQTKISYEPLATTPNYQISETDLPSPLRTFTPSWYIVTKVENDNAKGGFFLPTEYEYRNTVTHRLGKGFLGFQELIVKDDATNTYILKHNKFYGAENGEYYKPYYSLIEQYTLEDGGKGKLISKTTNKPDHINFHDERKVFFLYINKKQTEYFELTTGTSYKKEIVEKQRFDNYGNCEVKTVLNSVFNDLDHKTLIKTEYRNFMEDEKWILGKPYDITTTKKFLGNTTIPESVKHTALTYYSIGNLPDYGMLKTIVDEPSSLKANIKKYTYDEFGNISSSTIDSYHSPSNETERTTEIIFGPEYDHRFVTKLINPLQQTTSFNYDDTWGWKTKTTDPNGFELGVHHNVFGSVTRIEFHDGSAINRNIQWVLSGDDKPENAIYFVEEHKIGFAPTQTYYDRLTRALRIVSIGYNGEKIFQDFQYSNHDGKLISSTKPYYKGDVEYPTEFTYDEINRLTQKKLPDDRLFKYNYVGNIVGVINPKEQITSMIYGSLGKPTWINENFETEMHRKYDAEGRVLETKIKDEENTKITYEYDIFGQLIKTTDPTIGKKEYEYNCFGELELVKHNEVKEAENFKYDKLGRLTAMSEPGHGQTKYGFDEQYIGLPDEVSFVNSTDGGIFKNLLDYDEYGRNRTTTDLIKSNGINEVFEMTTRYDDIGRPEIFTYPSGFSIVNVYNQHGYLQKIIRSADSKTLWENKKMNAEQQFLEYSYGNGTKTNKRYIRATGFLWTSAVSSPLEGEFINKNEYNWDEIGNLTSRQIFFRPSQYKIESFEYDGLNRLKQSQYYYHGNYGGKVELEYDNLGRILYKKSNNPAFHVADNYTYDDNGPNPYKLLEIDNSPAFYNPELQNVEYTIFDKVGNIKQYDNKGRLRSYLDIIYGNGHQRKLSVEWNRKTTDKTTKIFASSIYEKTITEDISGNKKTKEVHYLNAPTGLFAIFTKTDGYENTNYVHKNNLGSITELTNEKAQIVERYSYDAWGRRRVPYSLFPIEEAEKTETDRGFTGHEHLDLFAMVNMNGRIYDPVVGYFTSPDPMIGIPNGTQGFNLYSYVFNNPLKYTDPSGYKASEIADIGAGPMWYQLFGSELTPSWLNVDVGNFYSGDFAGGFDEAIGGDGDKKKKSSSARRPKPSKNKTRRCFEWNSLDDANGSSGLGPVDPYRNIEFDNEKVINDLSDFDDGTQPSRRVNPAGGSAGGGELTAMSEPAEALANGVNRTSGVFGTAAALTILEEGTSVGLKVVTKSATYINIGITIGVAYNEYASGKANTHTLTDIGITALTVGGAAVALTFGAPVVAAGFVVGGAVYGIGSIFLNESIDNVSNNWGREVLYNR